MTQLLPAHLAEAALLERLGTDDREAFDELARRHGPAAWRLAVIVSPDAVAACRNSAMGVARAFAAPRTAPRTGPLRVAVLAAVRAAADPAAAQGGAWSPVPDDATDAERRLLAALGRLPEHHRSALWLVDAERLDAGAVAVILAIPDDSVRLLHLRARAALRCALAAEQAAAIGADVCRSVTQALPGMGPGMGPATGAARAGDRRRIRGHLDRCAACAGHLRESKTAPGRLRSAVAFPSAPPWDEAWALYRSLTAGPAGPFGLMLPGGRPVPRWAERALAGATAAAISVGIAGAVALGARDTISGTAGEPRPDRLAQAGEPRVPGSRASSGEPRSVPAPAPVVLGELPALPSFDTAARTPQTPEGNGSPVFATAGPTPATPAPRPGPAPGPAPAPLPAREAGPGPDTAPQPGSGDAGDPDPGTGGSPLLEVPLGDLGGVVVGEDCTGLTAGPATLGCEATGTHSPGATRVGPLNLP